MRLPTLSVGAGEGFVARRERAVAFVSTDTAEGRALLEVFARTAGDEAAVEACCSSLGELDAVIVGWSNGIRLICSGDAEIRSDRPEMTMMSARSSATWVERRLDDGAVVIDSGVGGSDDTELGDGRVRGGGFSLLMVAGVAAPATEPPPTSTRRPVASAGLDPLPPTPGPVVEPAPEATDDGPPIGVDDWMEESLGLGSAASIAPSSSLESSPESAAGTADVREPRDAISDDERTIGPDGRPLAVGSIPSWPGDVEPDAERGAEATPDPETSPAGSDSIDTEHPRSGPAPDDRPVHAVLRTPNGASHPVRGEVVIGRKPAGASDAFEVVVVDHPSVSRRHAWIRLDGASLVVRDVGSTAGTALISPDGAVVELDVEVDYPLPVGSALLLGGPTRIEVFAGEGDRG